MLALVEQHVGGLDVAVYEPSRMGGVQRVGDLRADGDRPRRLELSLVREQPLEVCALDVAHGQVELSLHLARVVDGHDIRMVEGSRQPRLDEEALAEVGILRQLWREQLERHAAVQRQIVGAVDDAHATAAEISLLPARASGPLTLRADAHFAAHSASGAR